ncbi:folylpolyglutamate synthase: mitochondrial-like isoform X1 [Dinothrombium tinctorium]|uniref:Folylpolyglutamate synthase n=1 Tax=Dinothrombium tinctorium TaxID=1965070 RepID=A0A443RDU2_9ACAR|nr:folylpolyglutamate synthase: mitochondrial-like isoform X1 [Dinothrombium tinctorium]
MDIVKSDCGDYEDAIIALNNLQSNASVVEKAVKERDANAHKSLIKCLRNLKVLGIKETDLDRLNVIHVAGTKGKGSTCALVESILRRFGYKTGLYTSPHIIEVRERIRICGQPLTKKQFSSCFWHVFNEMQANDETKNDMPAYFVFLTLMAFHVFIKEKVDVAILEVGIGGKFDTTNVVPKPAVVAVTSLGFDHTNLLGNTIESIANQKAGIFREAVAAFTVEQTYDGALDVLLKNAQEVKCPLYICPSLSSYSTENGKPPIVGIAGEAQSTNASLALQLCSHWLKVTKNGFVSMPTENITEAIKAEPFLICRKQLEGLKSCKWPGRCQLISKDNIHFFLDGAHTPESVQHGVKWFKDTSKELSSGKKVFKALLFNNTGQRDVQSLLKPLSNIDFDIAFFCPNIVKVEDCNESTDVTNFNMDLSKQHEIAETNCKRWLKLSNLKCKAYKFDCISNVLDRINEKSHTSEVHLLVTGSLHLVGACMSIIEPNLET